ncbi:hypothetical protein M5K25_013199 [Dendrobium thyrsiflorum]|uniref:Retrotransposon gag domain-containing protein n=1 Tax=Dendrobium thyrsiflorum TaxID=117978 RepID=A0ABD0UZS6_DENTH
MILPPNGTVGKRLRPGPSEPDGLPPNGTIILRSWSSPRMDKQDAPITVHLGRGARIQLANTVINTGSTGATIQFGSVDFSAITARTTVPRAHLPVPQTTARDIPQGRTSVFERLSQPETLTAKRVVDGRKVSVVTADTTALPRETVTSGIYDAEASSSGGRLNRRQRRKRNAELRVQQLPVPVHPSNIPAEELQTNIPTRNKFTDLKWVKRNSSTGELKQSFWEHRPEAPTPQIRGPERLSARVHRVLKTVKDKGLMKKKFQKPLMIEARRTPPRERLSTVMIAERREEQRQAPREAHRGVTLGPRIQGSAVERAQRKDKQVWRPKPQRKKMVEEREISGVTSEAVSRRSAPFNQIRQKWVQRKAHNDTNDSRHLGESSMGSRHSPTMAKEELNFDRSPRIEETLIPNQEPEIHWRRRSEVQVQEEEYDDEDTMEVEVVYMVSHIDENDSDDEEDRRSQTREQARRRRRGARSVTSQSVRSSEEEEGEEVEENLFAAETLTLAQMRRQMRRQMKEKDKEISHLNEKMTEMMTQMTTMMEMMQKATSVGPVPAQPINHAASIAPANLPNPHVPQASGIKGTPEGGNEAVDNTRQRTPQNIASASEPVTAAQLEGLISEKIKAILASEQAEKLVGKGRPYPLEYDQVSYPKGYSVPKFYTFNGNNNNNPRQHIAQFKATCGNTGGKDALLFRQFVSSLTGIAFEWYVELPNDSVKTFAELETLFVKRFASAVEKTTIADLALDKRKKEESVTKYITCWRNLSMKCEQQLEEEHAVQLLMGNIDDKMQPFLCMSSITTFQDLLDRVAKFEKLNLSKSESHPDKPKKAKASDTRKGEAYSISPFKLDKKKLAIYDQGVYNADKGKQPMQYEDKPKQVYTPSSQPKLVLGGNDKPRALSGGGECPRQAMGTGDRTFPSLKDKMNKEYSFKRESVAKLFRQALKAGMELPECKRPEESKHSGDPNYCPYHRVISHPIEDCYVFKDWLERKYKKGEFTLSDNVLIHPRKESTRVVTSSSVPPPKEAIKEKSIQGEQWETVVSKKTTKMLKQLEGVPGVKWKSPTEPVLNLKWLPMPHASTYKQQPGQASSSKSDKKKSKSAKKKAKIKKPKKKKTATQRVIDSLGEYHQIARRPIKLGDFMIGLKINEEEERAEDESLPTETCRFISATSEISEREKYAEEAAPEFCLMVSSMDYSSEEDLHFPREDDMDPDIASQMEQVNLEDNSESTGESPDATMADSEENTASNKSESDEVAQLKSSSSLEAKASTSKIEKRPKQGGEMKQRGGKRVTPTLPKAVATSKTKRAVPHLGSDTEEDEAIPVKAKKNSQPTARGKKKAEDLDPDYDYETTYANSVQGIFSRRIDSLSVSDSVLVVTRIPLEHFKEVIPREVYNVEELVTFYVRPHKEKGGPGRLFYSVGKLNEEENRDWYRRIIDSGELLPTRLPRFNTKGIRRMLRKQINIPTSKRQLCFCLSICLNGRIRSDSTSPDVAESLAALSTQQVIRKTVVAEPPFQQMDDEELSNLSSFSLTNSSNPDWSLLDRLRVRILPRQNDHLYTYFFTWWEEVRRGACDEVGDPKVSFSVFATDRQTAYTRSSPARWDGKPVRRLQRERDIHKYPLAGKRLRLFQTGTPEDPIHVFLYVVG